MKMEEKELHDASPASLCERRTVESDTPANLRSLIRGFDGSDGGDAGCLCVCMVFFFN
jgi:hypothetical protein